MLKPRAFAIFPAVSGLQLLREPRMLPIVLGETFALNARSAFVHCLNFMARRICALCGRAVKPRRVCSYAVAMSPPSCLVRLPNTPNYRACVTDSASCLPNFPNFRVLARITAVFFVSSRDTLDLPYPCPCSKVMTVSRLAERLKELLNTRGLTQAEVVRRSEDIGKYVSKGTVSTYLSNPPQRPKRQVIEALAEILDVPVSDLEEAATFTGREPFAPDPSSDRLTTPQRAAVNEIIRQLAEANTRAGDGDGNATPMNQAGASPAPEDDGLGSFGGRARGDLDHESKNDGDGDNVHELFTPPPPASETAAWETENRGRKTRQQQDDDAEGSQDPEDDEE